MSGKVVLGSWGLLLCRFRGAARVCVAAVRRDLGREECGELAGVLGPLAQGAVEAFLAPARAAGADLSGVPLNVVGCWG